MGGACTFVPVKSEDEVQEDDIVFCSVQPGNRIYGQIVKRQWWLYQSWKGEVNANQYMYTIGSTAFVACAYPRLCLNQTKKSWPDTEFNGFAQKPGYRLRRLCGN